jgi:hypothetical protein|uniref:Glycine-rich protein n=1 Tax=Picea glauca TaxID=3330 RepID=A0A101M2W0_PICGL|nr:hypothetical protein ABT39_MTgene3126 [Picea glauca]
MLDCWMACLFVLILGHGLLSLAGSDRTGGYFDRNTALGGDKSIGRGSTNGMDGMESPEMLAICDLAQEKC